MKIKHLQLASLTMLVILGTSCRKDNAVGVVDGTKTAVSFSSTIEGQIKTKAADGSWSANDKIGVYMKSGSGLTGVLAINKAYGTNGDGSFTPVTTDQTIYYPENGSAVDFIAYYQLRKR